MTYRILAQRSGGMMGYSEAWAKIDEVIYETEDKGEAEQLAKQWEKAMNDSYSTCRITYRVKEFY